MRQHLAEMGFVVGEQVRVVTEIGGNVILQVKESRVALSKAMANRIQIGYGAVSRSTKTPAGWRHGFQIG